MPTASGPGSTVRPTQDSGAGTPRPHFSAEPQPQPQPPQQSKHAESGGGVPTTGSSSALMLFRVLRAAGARAQVALPSAHPHLRTAATASIAVDARPPPPPPSRPQSRQPHGKSKPQSYKQQLRRSRIRVNDPDLAVLVARRSSPEAFGRAVRALRTKDEISLLAAADARVWELAFRMRLETGDESGAARLLALVARFAPENASESVWTDLFFTLLRQRAASHSHEAETRQLLDELQTRYGPHFLVRVLVALVNGCTNADMLSQARFLMLYHQSMALQPHHTPTDTGTGVDTSTNATTTAVSASERAEIRMPARIVGNLVSRMADAQDFAGVLSFTEELLASPTFEPARDFQQQGFLALFRACVERESPASLRSAVRHYLAFVDAAVTHAQGDLTRVRALVLERGVGAAIQSAVALNESALALHCYQAMERTRAQLTAVDELVDEKVDKEVDLPQRVVDAVLPADENMYVNVMKACVALGDWQQLKEAYRAMAARGVGRSAGFGSAIRYCHAQLDAEFLSEVLEDVFMIENELQGEWMLAVENYNDALGCFAGTRSFEQAQDLFARLLGNPFLKPDHITMLEMVENHREAPFAELFHLMELFLEYELEPNLQVYTSLLSTCMRRRLVGDAVALMNTMKQRGVEPDVKAYTTTAFIYASHGELQGVAGILRDMEKHGVATDQTFFDYVVNGIYGSCGIDMCFALFRELSVADVTIPEGMYVALIKLGTDIGLIERTLRIAYNMECDGFQLSSEQLSALISRCRSDAELKEMVHTFTLLHQGRQPATPRFEIEVYEDLIAVLTRFNRRDVIPKVKAMAAAAGHTDAL